MSYDQHQPVEAAAYVVDSHGGIPVGQAVIPPSISPATYTRNASMNNHVPAATQETSASSLLNEGAVREFLTQEKWPPGLQDVLVKNLSAIPLRFFICDDSGSMGNGDGHRLMEAGGKKKLVSCSRWSELATSLKFHANLARYSCAATEFRMLNGAQPIMIGPPETDPNGTKFSILLDILDAGSPSGGTPLCRHIREVIEIIRSLENGLRAAGQRVCVIICSDGESSDGDVAKALKPLKDLPCWVVVRLCTDEEKVVKYWNDIDNNLELEMDVLDDLFGEAEEVQGVNGWLTYAEPLHRLREFGIPAKQLDLLDESLLSAEDMLKVCVMIFGGRMSDYPHPQVDWDAFMGYLQTKNHALPEVYNVTKQRNERWLDTSKLAKLYGPSSGGCTLS